MKNHKSLIKAVAGVLLLSFVSQELAMARGVATAPAKPISIPKGLGTPRDGRATSSPEKIIHIEDAHDSLEAQHKIASILGVLASDYNVRTVALEGAWGEFDAALFRTYPDQTWAKSVAEDLVKEGRLNAGELFAITSERPVSVYGVEEKTLYRENLKAFRDLLGQKKMMERDLKGLERTLAVLAERVYGEGLKELRRSVVFSGEGDRDFTKKWESLKKIAAEKSVSFETYGELKKLSRVVDLEKEINFSRANAERDGLLRLFKERLKKRDLDAVVLKSLDFKAGRITDAEYHLFLSDTAGRGGSGLDEFPNLAVYVKYLALFGAIDLTAVLGELGDFERRIKETFLVSDDEKTLDRLEETYRILACLVSGRASSDEFAFFKAHPHDFNEVSFARRLEEMARRHRVPLYGTRVKRLLAALPAAKRFYTLAEERNAALLENTLKRMRANGERVAALVTGGFHTKGISELLKSKDLSYLVVLPKITDPAKKRPYITVLTRKREAYVKTLSADASRFQIALGAEGLYAGSLAELDGFLERLVKGPAKVADWMGKYAKETKRSPDEIARIKSRLLHTPGVYEKAAAGAENGARLALSRWRGRYQLDIAFKFMVRQGVDRNVAKDLIRQTAKNASFWTWKPYLADLLKVRSEGDPDPVHQARLFYAAMNHLPMSERLRSGELARQRELSLAARRELHRRYDLEPTIEILSAGTAAAPNAYLALPKGASAEAPRPAVILYPGLTHDYDQPYLDGLEIILLKRGYAVLRVDPPGHGANRDKLIGGKKQLADFADAVTETLRLDPRIDPDRVGAFGFSFGGYIASLGRRGLAARAVMNAPLRKTFDSVVNFMAARRELEDMFGERTFFGLLRKLRALKMSVAELERRVDMSSVFYVSGGQDPVVSRGDREIWGRRVRRGGGVFLERPEQSHYFDGDATWRTFHEIADHFDWHLKNIESQARYLPGPEAVETEEKLNFLTALLNRAFRKVFLPRVIMEGAEHLAAIPHGRSVLILPNHSNPSVEPVLIVAAVYGPARRLVRFLTELPFASWITLILSWLTDGIPYVNWKMRAKQRRRDRIYNTPRSWPERTARRAGLGLKWAALRVTGWQRFMDPNVRQRVAKNLENILRRPGAAVGVFAAGEVHANPVQNVLKIQWERSHNLFELAFWTKTLIVSALSESRFIERTDDLFSLAWKIFTRQKPSPSHRIVLGRAIDPYSFSSPEDLFVIYRKFMMELIRDKASSEPHRREAAHFLETPQVFVPPEAEGDLTLLEEANLTDVLRRLRWLRHREPKTPILEVTVLPYREIRHRWLKFLGTEHLVYNPSRRAWRRADGKLAASSFEASAWNPREGNLTLSSKAGRVTEVIEELARSSWDPEWTYTLVRRADGTHVLTRHPSEVPEPTLIDRVFGSRLAFRLRSGLAEVLSKTGKFLRTLFGALGLWDFVSEREKLEKVIENFQFVVAAQEDLDSTALQIPRGHFFVYRQILIELDVAVSSYNANDLNRMLLDKERKKRSSDLLLSLVESARSRLRREPFLVEESESPYRVSLASASGRLREMDDALGELSRQLVQMGARKDYEAIVRWRAGRVWKGLLELKSSRKRLYDIFSAELDGTEEILTTYFSSSGVSAEAVKALVWRLKGIWDGKDIDGRPEPFFYHLQSLAAESDLFLISQSAARLVNEGDSGVYGKMDVQVSQFLQRDLLADIQNFNAEKLAVFANVYQNAISQLQRLLYLSLSRLELDIKGIRSLIEVYLHFLNLLKPVSRYNNGFPVQFFVNHLKSIITEFLIGKNAAFETLSRSARMPNRLLNVPHGQRPLRNSQPDMLGVNESHFRLNDITLEWPHPRELSERLELEIRGARLVGSSGNSFVRKLEGWKVRAVSLGKKRENQAQPLSNLLTTGSFELINGARLAEGSVQSETLYPVIAKRYGLDPRNLSKKRVGRSSASKKEALRLIRRREELRSLLDRLDADIFRGVRNILDLEKEIIGLKQRVAFYGEIGDHRKEDTFRERQTRVERELEMERENQSRLNQEAMNLDSELKETLEALKYLEHRLGGAQFRNLELTARGARLALSEPERQRGRARRPEKFSVREAAEKILEWFAADPKRVEFPSWRREWPRIIGKSYSSLSRYKREIFQELYGLHGLKMFDLDEEVSFTVHRAVAALEVSEFPALALARRLKKEFPEGEMTDSKAKEVRRKLQDITAELHMSFNRAYALYPEVLEILRKPSLLKRMAERFAKTGFEVELPLGSSPPAEKLPPAMRDSFKIRIKRIAASLKQVDDWFENGEFKQILNAYASISREIDEWKKELDKYSPESEGWGGFKKDLNDLYWRLRMRLRQVVEKRRHAQGLGNGARLAMTLANSHTPGVRQILIGGKTRAAEASVRGLVGEMTEEGFFRLPAAKQEAVRDEVLRLLPVIRPKSQSLNFQDALKEIKLGFYSPDLRGVHSKVEESAVYAAVYSKKVAEDPLFLERIEKRNEKLLDPATGRPVMVIRDHLYIRKGQTLSDDLRNRFPGVVHELGEGETLEDLSEAIGLEKDRVVFVDRIEPGPAPAEGNGKWKRLYLRGPYASAAFQEAVVRLLAAGENENILMKGLRRDARGNWIFELRRIDLEREFKSWYETRSASEQSA